VTTDWYIVADYPKVIDATARRTPKNGDVECRDAHEDRIRRETRLEPADRRPEDKT
jgi:hypothetical protein